MTPVTGDSGIVNVRAPLFHFHLLSTLFVMFVQHVYPRVCAVAHEVLGGVFN